MPFYLYYLPILGQKLNVDIYLAAIVVFVGRMFNNLAIIRRYYLEKWDKKDDTKKQCFMNCYENITKLLQIY